MSGDSGEVKRMYMMVFDEASKGRMDGVYSGLVWCEVVGVNVEGQGYVLMANPKSVVEEREDNKDVAM